jgi:hypothetical protein
MRLNLTYAPGDATLAARIQQDLRAAGYTVHEPAQPNAPLVAVLSPGANTDQAVQNRIIQALDQHQHIIPVFAQTVPLPKLIDHLQPLDFSSSYNFPALTARLDGLATARPPLTVRTPTIRKANRRIGYVLVFLALFWFALGFFLVGGGFVRPPDSEYNAIETEIVLTRNYYLDMNRPRTTEQAANFPATLKAAPTAQRPFLVETATAMVVSSTLKPRR